MFPLNLDPIEYILMLWIEQFLCAYVYLRFIDDAKVFDNATHNELLEMLWNVDIFGKDKRIIQNLYCE